MALSVTRAIDLRVDKGFGPYEGMWRVSAECDDECTAVLVSDGVSDPPLATVTDATIASHPLVAGVVEEHIARCEQCSRVGGDRLIVGPVDPTLN